MVMVRKSGFTEKLLSAFTYICVTLFSFVCALPFWMVFIGSFTAEESIRKYGFQIIPDKLSLYAYQFIFSGKQLWRSYGVTILVVVAGTALAAIISSMLAYVMAHPKAKYGNAISFITYFTMIFGGGLVGFYILIANWLHLKDSLWALILPYLINPFYTFILVAFFRSLPYEISQSASIDGANDIYIFYKIIWPMSTPAIATVVLFYSLQYWNDWWLALLFIDNYKLHPLQIMLRKIASQVNIQSYAGVNSVYQRSVPTYGVQFAIVCLVIGPIIFLYPFVQKYFVKGLTLGAVKG